MVKSNSREAIEYLAKSVRDAFKDMSLSTRRRAWSAITSSKGKEEVRKMIFNLNRPQQLSVN